MKVYILSIIFSADQKQKKPFVLTSSSNKYLIPLLEIEHMEHFHNEIFHKLKSIFVHDSIKISTECSYSFLDIQNELSVRYALENYDFVQKDDMIITYGGMFLKYKCLDNFQWSEYKLHSQHNGYGPDINLNLLLDYVIQRSQI